MTGVLVTQLAKDEARALRMLRTGWAVKDVATETGLTLEQVTTLRRDDPHDHTRCGNPHCGQPQHGAGRPRTGWVQIKPAAQIARWFCGWACAERHVLRELRKAAAA
jgi:hypothetical protein